VGVFSVMEIAGSGLNVFRTWLDATADNISNMQSIGTTPGGQPFRSKLVIAQANGVDGADGEHGAHVVNVVRQDEQSRPLYDPGHPLADPVTGEVKYPGVDLNQEMVNAVVAQRGYQANISVLQYARDAYQAALRLGR
jgi:flagellar basal-body rod protein FlgC